MRQEGRNHSSWLGSAWVGVAVLLLAATTAPAQTAAVSADLAGPLRDIALAHAAGVVAPASATQVVAAEGGRVRVEVLFRGGGSAGMLASLGAIVEHVSGNRAQALVPMGALNAVASLPEVAQVRLPHRWFSFQAPISEGVQLTGATAFHANGVIASGVRVAVIDAGFGETSHGAAVTQIVQGMAPGAEVTQLTAGTNLEVEQAITQVRDGGYDIAVMSMGSFEGPFDGTHSTSQKVNGARTAGVFWVNAAGNHAQRHYEGDWTDANGDGVHEWAAGDSLMGLNLPAGQFEAYLSWFETAGATTNHDYDLVLQDASGTQIASSNVTQNGDDPPAERLLAYVPAAGVYNLRIVGMSPAGITLNDHFQLFLPTIDVEGTLRVAERSLAVPAEATGSFTVGATRGSLLLPAGLEVKPIDDIEDFSSRGPSLSGLLKPDLCAPNVVTTTIETQNPFIGTSAAAPHVAGAAALLLGEDATRTPATLAGSLRTLAVKDRLAKDPSNNPIPDNIYGHGRLRVRVGTDSTAPQISISFPRNGQTISVSMPTLVATITDLGSGIDPETIVIRLDGTIVTGWQYNAQTGALTYTVPEALTRTAHSFTVDASDYDGNAAATAASNFRVASPTIEAGLHMISLPYAGLINDDPSQIFGMPYNQLQLARWVPEDTRESKYHFYPDDYASFEPPDAQGADAVVSDPPAGLGYFLRLPQLSTLNIGTLGTINDQETYTIRLIYGTDAPRGWNMIGNPFDGVLDWGTVAFEANGQRYDLREAMEEEAGITEGVIFDFISTTTGGYYQFSADPAQDVMEFMRGYWVHVLQDADLVVYNPSISAVASVQSTPATALNRAATDGWSLQLSAQCGEYLDPVNYIGIHPQGTDGYDSGLDLPEPPALTAGLSLYMPQRDWGSKSGHYVRDVRSALNGRETWDLEVNCSLSGAPVRLSWDGINETVPAGVSLVLHDVDADRQVYMRTATSYTYTAGDGQQTRHLKIIASTDGVAALAVGGVNVAQTGDGTVAISYSVTRSATVSADIRNIAGYPIARLGGGEAVGGTTQTLTWNGRNASGARVPNGRYLVRLTAQTAEGQTVQAISVFDKTR